MFKQISAFCFSLISFPLFTFGTLDSHINETSFLQQLDTIKNIFEVTYAPKKWKKTQFGWNMHEELKQIRRKMQQGQSLRDYQKLLTELFFSAKDYHAGIHFSSTAVSLLPLRIQKIKDAYYVAYALDIPEDIAQYYGMTGFIKVGDQILEVDGRPIDEVIQEIKETILFDSKSATDQRLAEIYLMFRQGASGQDTPQGVVTLKAKNQNGQIQDFIYPWIHRPEEVMIPMGLDQGIGLETQNATLKKFPVLDKKMIIPFYQKMVQSQAQLKKTWSSFKAQGNDQEGEEEEPDQLLLIGSPKPFLPPLGQVIWKPEHSFFSAYLSVLPSGKKVGYFRIASYMGDEEAIEELEKIITFFQQESDVLIVDQLNNPGGILLYKYAIASLLTDRPLETSKGAMAITQQEVMGCLDLRDYIDYLLESGEPIAENIIGYVFDKDHFLKMREYCECIIQHWNSGKFLTAPIAFLGIDTVKPHPCGYTKPIVILTNELDFSCADFFPALMQDNQRALIFGTKTAGAGGHIVETFYPNLFGISRFITTGSIGYRQNGKPIENLGVTPDVIYEMSERDLTHHYQDYLQALQKVVEKL